MKKTDKFQPLDMDDAFEAFMRQCYRDIPATSTQYRESRRIFYAGAVVIFNHAALVGDVLDDESGLLEIKQIQGQFTEFFLERVMGDKD